MSDTYTETTTRSFGARMADSITGVVAGVALVPLAVGLLFWNEGRAVKTARALDEGAGAVVSVDPARVDPGHEQALVHLAGEATTDETLADPDFGVAQNALVLRRVVSVYQWKEEQHRSTRDKLGGGQETQTDYTYTKVWSDDLIDSSHFKGSAHRNPPAKAYPDQRIQAERATVGAFRLTSGLLARIGQFQPKAVTETDLPAGLRGKVKVDGSTFYAGADPARPEIGDARIRFEVAAPQAVSIVARQVEDSFQPYPTKAGRELEMLSQGSHSPESMFTETRSENTLLTWVLRGVGVAVLWIGLALLLGPLSTLLSFIPFLGDIVGGGVAVASGLVAFILAALVIASGWLFFRPLVGGGLLALAGALVVLLWNLRRTRVADATAAAEGPPPS
jgi:Transmembrane protein 43